MMKSPVFRFVANGVSYLLLFGVFLTLFWSTFQGRLQGAALLVFSTTVETPIVRNGDTVTISFVSSRYRLCRTDIDRYIMRAADSTVVYRDRIVGGVTTVGSRMLTRTEMKLPPLMPGKYIYRGFVHSDCGDNDRHTAVQPDGYFEVVD